MKAIACFYHLPKTGGSTLTATIRNNINDNEYLIFNQELGDFSFALYKRMGQKELIKYASGHRLTKEFVNYNKSIRKVKSIILIREPAEQIVSSYNHDMNYKFSVKIPFYIWYNFFTVRNPQTSNILRRYIGRFLESININRKKYNNVVNELKDFYYVGVTEHLSKDLKYIMDSICVSDFKEVNKNVSGIKHKKFLYLDQNLKEKLNNENKYDMKLYEYALKRRNKFIENFNDEKY